MIVLSFTAQKSTLISFWFTSFFKILFWHASFFISVTSYSPFFTPLAHAHDEQPGLHHVGPLVDGPGQLQSRHGLVLLDQPKWRVHLASWHGGARHKRARRVVGGRGDHCERHRGAAAVSLPRQPRRRRHPRSLRLIQEDEKVEDEEHDRHQAFRHEKFRDVYFLFFAPI
jgi:hypothetical protein